MAKFALWSSLSEKQRKVTANLAMLLAGALLTTGIAYVVGPRQAVNSQRAVNADTRAEGSTGPPLAITEKYLYDELFDQSPAPNGWVTDRRVPPSIADEVINSRQFDTGTSLDLAGIHTERVAEPSAVRIAQDKSEGTPNPELESMTPIKLDLVGRRPDEVLVENIHADILRRRRPPDGTLFMVGTQGEGNVVGWGFDLDSSDEPEAHLIRGYGGLGALYESGKYLTLRPGEPAVVNVYAYTRSCSCDWQIDLDVRWGKGTAANPNGHVEHVTIPGGGRTFHSVALARRYGSRFLWDVSKGKYVERPGTILGHDGAAG